MYVFLKGKVEGTYVTFCRGIAGERLLRVGYLGCLGKGRHISGNGIGEEEEEEEGCFLFIRTEEREVLDLGRYL